MSTPSSKKSKAVPPVNPPAGPNPLLELLDITPHPKGFKNPDYKPAARRNKNLKQMLSDAAAASKPSAAGPTSGPTSAPAAPTASVNEMQTTYANIESAPSFKRGNRWCDITGLPAKYTDPKTKLRYRDGEVYKVVRSLAPGGPEMYLSVRGANVVLK
ncbi:hypothetical protein BZA77DRAFT_316848 [Pyronema omphalodes]|nr:hypothetical protein BZA77DRAFT_316848 [Pyronema omphalodes]